ncbi:MAG: HAD family hydrolase [Alphaproteobacteria bacterium]|nr:HAD family hydrolase [Alphaproteobacteria bacterium]
MPLIQAAGRTVEIALAAFDKDGTLVDFDRLWATKIRASVTAVLERTGRSDGLEPLLLRTLGVDAASGSVLPESPMAVSTLPKIGTICAAVLYQHGFGWRESETIVREAFQPVLEAPAPPDALRPIGDVAALFADLKRSGAAVAIVTSDDRRSTSQTLAPLGIEALVDGMVCGDDRFASKPSPDGLLHLAQSLGVAPDQVMMVGDSATDVLTGRNAGAGLCVGVLSGIGRHEDMAPHADAVLPDIHALRILQGG